MREYSIIMEKFLSRAAKVISERPKVLAELKEKEALFKTFDMEDDERKTVFFDWFIFDYTSRTLSCSIAEYLIRRAADDNETLQIYRGFLNNVFSIFEVKALRMGKEMVFHDLLNDREYKVRDASMSRVLKKKECIFARILPFRDYYILSGLGYSFPPESAHLIKLVMREPKDSGAQVKLTPLLINEILHQSKEKERISPRDRFVSLGKAAGLDEKYIQEILERTLKAVENGQGSREIIKEFVGKMRPGSKVGVGELTGSYIDIYNSFVADANPEFRKGPLEIAVIQAGMSYIQEKVDPDKFGSVEDAERAAEKIQRKWMKTPLQELGGKTPEDVILEERRKTGNPQKDVTFKIQLTRLVPGSEIKEKAEELFNRGFRFLKDNNPSEAVKAYREYLSINPGNFVVWQNLGVAYVLLLDKKNAVKCFKKAVKINPDYMIAKENLAKLKKATAEQFEEIAKESLVRFRNEGRIISEKKMNRIIEKTRKKGCKIKIELTREQYKELIKLVYLGEWLANAHCISREDEKFNDIANYIYSYAADFGLEDLVEYDRKSREYYPTAEFDEDPEVRQFIDKYNNENFWDELTNRMAVRDFVRKYGKAAINKMTWEERIEKEDPFIEKYQEEFAENGLMNLGIIYNGKPRQAPGKLK